MYGVRFLLSFWNEPTNAPTHFLYPCSYSSIMPHFLLVLYMLLVLSPCYRFFICYWFLFARYPCSYSSTMPHFSLVLYMLLVLCMLGLLIRSLSMLLFVHYASFLLVLYLLLVLCILLVLCLVLFRPLSIFLFVHYTSFLIGSWYVSGSWYVIDS